MTDLDPTADPGRTPGSTLAVTALGVGLVLYVTVGAAAQISNVGFGMWFTSIFVFFAVSWELTRLSGRDPATYTGSNRFSWGAVGVGALLGAINFIAVVIPLQLLTQSLVGPYIPNSLKQDARVLFEVGTPVELVAVIGAVIFAAALGEELFFRGVLLRGLAEGGHRSRALWISALVFSAFHFDAMGFLARVELGVLFGVLFFTTRSIWAGLAAHAVNNAIGAGLFLVGRDAAPSVEETVPPAHLSALFLVAGSAAMIALWKKLEPALARQGAASPDASLLVRPSSLWPAILRWGGAAVLAAAILFAVDRRGVALNWVDARYSLPTGDGRSKRNDPARVNLRRLKAEARRGTVPIDVYAAHRKERSEAERAATKH